MPLPIASVPLVRVFGAADVRPGPTAIVFLTAVGFFLPAVLLSAVTPLVIKIELADPAQTGQVVGTLSALGTAGSLGRRLHHRVRPGGGVSDDAGGRGVSAACSC